MFHRLYTVAERCLHTLDTQPQGRRVIECAEYTENAGYVEDVSASHPSTRDTPDLPDAPNVPNMPNGANHGHNRGLAKSASQLPHHLHIKISPAPTFIGSGLYSHSIEYLRAHSVRGLADYTSLVGSCKTG